MGVAQAYTKVEQLPFRRASVYVFDQTTIDL